MLKKGILKMHCYKKVIRMLILNTTNQRLMNKNVFVWNIGTKIRLKLEMSYGLILHILARWMVAAL